MAGDIRWRYVRPIRNCLIYAAMHRQAATSPAKNDSS
jgi:hypothetical protein